MRRIPTAAWLALIPVLLTLAPRAAVSATLSAAATNAANPASAADTLEGASTAEGASGASGVDGASCADGANTLKGASTPESARTAEGESAAACASAANAADGANAANPADTACAAGAAGPAALAPAADRGAQLDTHSFVFARYASASSSALYAGYSFGAAGVLVGAVDNLRSGYRERLAGVMARLAWGGGQSLTVALAGADASDSRYLQLYLAPSFAMGRLSLSGTVEGYMPLLRSGARQLYVDSLTLLDQLGPRLAVGGSYNMGLAVGSTPNHEVGPTVQVALAGGALRGQLFHGLGRNSAEARAVYQASF